MCALVDIVINDVKLQIFPKTSKEEGGERHGSFI